MNPRLTFGAVGLLTLGVLTAGGVAFAAAPAPSAASSATSSGASSGAATASTSSAAASATPSTTSGNDIVLPAGSVLAKRTTAFCERSDEVIARITKHLATIDDKGTEAKAKAEKRVAKLREHTYDKRADAIQKRIDRRTERASKLPARLAAVKAAAQECESLGLS